MLTQSRRDAENRSMEQALDAFPRLALGQYPTPLYRLENLSRDLGHELYIKRDDELGYGLGGNKTRKLEYELAHAHARGARKIVTFGGLQSNHARLTAVNALRLEMEPHLFYFAKRPAQLQGNLLLNQVMGARLHFVPFGKGGDGSNTIEQTNRLVRLVALTMVGPHYFVPVGGHSVRGALGYVRAALELDEQARAQGIETARVFLAAGSGGTLAGLMAGLAICESKLRLILGSCGEIFAHQLRRWRQKHAKRWDWPRPFMHNTCHWWKIGSSARRMRSARQRDWTRYA